MKFKKMLIGAAVLLAAGGLLFSIQAFRNPVANAATGIVKSPQTAVLCGGAGLGRAYGSMISAVSKLIGLDQAEIRKQRQEGKSLAQIAESKGVSEDKLVKSIIEQRKVQLDKKVADGTITKEQEQYCLDNMEKRIKSKVERTTTGPADGSRRRGGGRGQYGGFGGGPGLGIGRGESI